MKELHSNDIYNVTGGVNALRLGFAILVPALIGTLIYNTAEPIKNDSNDIFYKFLSDNNRHCKAIAEELEKYKSLYGELPLTSNEAAPI